MMFGRRPNRPQSIRRDLDVGTILLLAAHIAQQARLAGFHIGGPHLLLGLLQFSGRIRDVTFSSSLRAARVDRSASIRSEAKTENLLAIITLVMRDLARLKIRGIGHPDIALAFKVEDPRYASSLPGGSQTPGIGSAHDLLHRKRMALRHGGDHAENNKKRGQLPGS